MIIYDFVYVVNVHKEIQIYFNRQCICESEIDVWMWHDIEWMDNKMGKSKRNYFRKSEQSINKNSCFWVNFDNQLQLDEYAHKNNIFNMLYDWIFGRC